MNSWNRLVALIAVLALTSAALAGGSGHVPASLRNTGYNPSKMRVGTASLRPWGAGDHGRTARIENIYANKLQDDALHIRAQSDDRGMVRGQYLTYGAIEIRNCEISNIWIPPGSGKHSDAIQVFGARKFNGNVRRPNLLIENVYIHDTGSGVMTCLVQEYWDTIVLRNVVMERVYSDIKLGNAKRIIIENCPGVNVGIYGVRGSTGEVIVRNSPGAKVQNRDYRGQNPGARITWDRAGSATTPSNPRPAPAARPAPPAPSSNGTAQVRFERPSRSGGGFRLTRCSEGGNALAYTRVGQWVEYTLTVPETRTYTFEFRHAQVAPGALFHVSVNGTPTLNNIGVTRTGNWTKWITGSKGGIRLTRGTHKIRIVFDRAAGNGYCGNFSWFRFR